MQTKRYKPAVDKLFWIIFIPTNAFLLCAMIIPAFFDLKAFFLMLPIFLFVNYFFLSPLFGYVELREKELFIKYGFFMKKQIPYGKIRELTKERRFISESMMSLKNAMEHINVKYNKFDVTVISVKNNDELIKEINAIRQKRCLL